jgi:hypothetical protein
LSQLAASASTGPARPIQRRRINISIFSIEFHERL